MVKKLRENEPIWISKINRRMSIHKFRENVSHIRSIGQDYSRVLHNLSIAYEVYEVTVETWTKGDVTLWVPNNYVEATGEMLSRFLEKNDQTQESTLLENDVTISDLIEIDDEEEIESEEEEEEDSLEVIDISYESDDSFFDPIETENNENFASC